MMKIFYIKVDEFNSLPKSAEYRAGTLERVYEHKGKQYLIVPRMWARDVVECYVLED